ncbi:MAG TPA: IS110 family transposase [Candidatus Binatia bacterium]|nr:IS110 family transposase [Candidatus Binatia bacterium]
MMSKKKGSVAGLGALYARVCGMDVHKNSVVACVRILNAKDGTVQSTLRRFGTMTADLVELRQWLTEQQVTHAAMESTGVYWQPVFNLLEGHLEVWVVNAQHIKKVPGRKTDMKDAEWIAQLMQCGLLKPSFVPERQQRELRDLTRQQSKLVQQRNAVDNRIQKVLETANIKLGSVASDVLGVSGRRMIEALIGGEKDTRVLADLAQKKLREKIPQLQRALEGEVSDHHRFLLRQLLDQYDFLEKEIARVSERLGAVAPPSFRAAVDQLDGIAGVGERGARALLAETGTDMSRFPSHKHFASWAGRCPGNRESAGKRKSGKTPAANRHLDAVLTEMAHAAVRKKDSYFKSQYHRLAGRRGKKRAIGEVKHSLLVTVYFMLRDHKPYEDLGADYFDKLNPQHQIRYHVRKLKDLGLKVEISPMADAA